MRFDFDEVSSAISDIKTNLERLNVLLDNIKYQFDTIVSDSVWNAYSSDYFSSELEIFYNEIRNVSSVSKNIIAYLEGIQENYRNLDNLSTRSTTHNAGTSEAGGRGRKF